jgi:hypothetical protein
VAKFHLEIDELERAILMFALGSLPHLAFPGINSLAVRLASLANGEPAARPSQPAGMPAAVETAAPAPTIASTPPARFIDPDVYESNFLADSITKVGKRLLVKWKEYPSERILQASCWDEKVFPDVLRCVKRNATYLLKSVKRGNATYLNVVGIKDRF